MRQLLDPEELRGLEDSLRPIAAQAARLSIPWMLVGAAGRDLILSQALSVRAGRATYDVDIAIQVRDWAEFEQLKNALRLEEGAAPHGEVPHRMILPSGIPIDLVPFGSIEVEGKVEWPPNQEPSLDVRGFAEALQLSVPIALSGGLEVRVPSLETYLCLKLFAWRDRHKRKPQHDSEDIREILKNADGLMRLETLYDENTEVMERNEFDATHACLELMGGRLHSALKPATQLSLQRLLKEQVDPDGDLALIRELGAGKDWIPGLVALLRGVEHGTRL